MRRRYENEYNKITELQFGKKSLEELKSINAVSFIKI